MRIVLKKKIRENLDEAISAVEKSGKEIEKIILTNTELDELENDFYPYTPLRTKNFGKPSYRGYCIETEE